MSFIIKSSTCALCNQYDLFLTAWQCVLRDIRSTQNSERNDRGPQEYVEKNPNPNLHCKLDYKLSITTFSMFVRIILAKN